MGEVFLLAVDFERMNCRGVFNLLRNGSVKWKKNWHRSIVVETGWMGAYFVLFSCFKLTLKSQWNKQAAGERCLWACRVSCSPWPWCGWWTVEYGAEWLLQKHICWNMPQPVPLWRGRASGCFCFLQSMHAWARACQNPAGQEHLPCGQPSQISMW